MKHRIAEVYDDSDNGFNASNAMSLTYEFMTILIGKIRISKLL